MSARSLATVLLMAVGLIAVVWGLATLQGPVILLLIRGRFSIQSGDAWKEICGAGGIPCLLVAIGCWLIFRPPLSLLRLAPAENDPAEAGMPQAQAILVVGMTLIGIYLLATAGPRLVNSLAYVGELSPRREDFSYPGAWVAAGTDALQVVFGIYFLFGAPIFSRWLMRRVLQSCAQGLAPRSRDAE